MKVRASSRSRWAFSAGIFVAALLVVVALPSAAVAQPTPSAATSSTAATSTIGTIQSVQAQQQQILAKISLLQPTLEIATEDYNKAAWDATETTQRLNAAINELSTAEVNLESARNAFNERLVAMYRTGKYGGLDLFLSVESVSELVNRLDFLIKMGDRDAETMKALAEEEQAAQANRDALAQLQQQATVRELETAQKKHDVEKLIAEQQALYDSLSSEFRALLDQQSAQQQAQQAQMVAEIKAQSGKYGITVEPGSPVETILGYIGVPYVWAGDSPKGFDCSGLVMYVMAQHGVQLPHYSRAQAELGTPVDVAQLAPADLVFFGSPIHHVGMYIGGGWFVEAPHTGDVVKMSKLAERSDFTCARRYPWVYKNAAPGASPTTGTAAAPGVPPTP